MRCIIYQNTNNYEGTVYVSGTTCEGDVGAFTLYYGDDICMDITLPLITCENPEIVGYCIDNPTPTPTHTSTPTRTPPPTPTHTSTPTPTPTSPRILETSTPTPTPTYTSTPTPTPTIGLTPTQTPTIDVTSTPTPTPTICAVPTLYLTSTSSNDACNQINGQFLTNISHTDSFVCPYCDWTTLNSTEIITLPNGTYYVSDGTNVRSWTKTSVPSVLYNPSACSSCPPPTPTPTPTIDVTSTPTQTPTPTDLCPFPREYNITNAGNFYWTDCNGIERYDYLTIEDSPICICNATNLPVSFDGGTGTLPGGGCICEPPPPPPSPTPTKTPTPTTSCNFYISNIYDDACTLVYSNVIVSPNISLPTINYYYRGSGLGDGTIVQFLELTCTSAVYFTTVTEPGSFTCPPAP